MTNLTRLVITAIGALVAIPVVWSMLIDTSRFLSPIVALGVMIAIVASILGYGYVTVDRAIAKRRRERTTADGRERQTYRPDAREP